MNCHFCNFDVTTYEQKKYGASKTWYHCPICGEIKLTEEAADDFEGERFTEDQKQTMCIVLRNEYERRGKKPPEKSLTLVDLIKFVQNYTPLDALDKMDQTLLVIDRMSEKKVGKSTDVNKYFDFPIFHCTDPNELDAILNFLKDEGLLNVGITKESRVRECSITVRGFQRLKELRQIYESNTCFVAMWFNPAEMIDVYEKAIKLAIEYKEEGKTEPRFRAIKLDNVEHINNINDEIIASIRRSRFMVCDLTGYRGGVYFEAGFANGLGLPVIYTCRKDWAEDEVLKDQKGAEVEELYYGNGIPMRIRKEGIHFDLAHMNRIEWDEDKLDDFRKALENRIKAVIV